MREHEPLREHQPQPPRRVVYYPFPMRKAAVEGAYNKIVVDSLQEGTLNKQAKLDLGQMRISHEELYSYLEQDEVDISRKLGGLYTYHAIRREVTLQTKKEEKKYPPILAPILPGVVTTYKAAIHERIQGVTRIREQLDIQLEEPNDIPFRVWLEIISREMSPAEATIFRYGAEDVYNVFQVNYLVRRLQGMLGEEL